MDGRSTSGIPVHFTLRSAPVLKPWVGPPIVREDNAWRCPHGGPKGLRMKRLGLVGVLVVLGLAEAAGQSQTMAAIRAAFVLNLVKFVQWPATPDSSPSPLVLCVFDDSAVLTALERVTEGQVVSRRGLAVRNLHGGADPRPCHVLYASGHDPHAAATIRTLLASVRDLPVLTIGDSEEFLQSGGSASLFTTRDQIQIAINATAVSRSRIRLSSKVMSLSRLVTETANARKD
jgi:hypothetical protein